MYAVRIQDGMKEQFCCSLISTFDGVSGQLNHQIALLRGKHDRLLFNRWVGGFWGFCRHYGEEINFQRSLSVQRLGNIMLFIRFFFKWSNSSQMDRASSYTMFLDHNRQAAQSVELL
jgi:hypothetical protein